MKVVKRIIVASFVLIIALSIMGCNGIKGKVVDSGIFSALCPEGWCNKELLDPFVENKDINHEALCFVKGDNPEDAYNRATVDINHYDPGTIQKDVKDIFENPEEVEYTIKGEKWTGFIGNYRGKTNAILTNEDGTVSVSFYLTDKDKELTLDAPELQAILGSISTN